MVRNFLCTGILPCTFFRAGWIALFLFVWSYSSAVAQGNDPDSANVTVVEAEYAPSSGGFGIFGGSSFELSTLKTTDLDSDLDQSLLLKSGYGYVIISKWLIGGGGGGVDLEDPNDSYHRFQMSYSGFLTGYDQLLAKDFSVRATLMVGGGELSMIKNRPDLASLGENSFLERFREEDFFLLRPEFSVGYALFSNFDFRLSAGYWYPIGGQDADDLRQFTFGFHALLGFRNNILN